MTINMTVKQLGEQMDKNFKQMDNKLEKMIKDNEEIKSKNIQIQEDINEIRNKIIENLGIVSQISPRFDPIIRSTFNPKSRSLLE